MNNLDADSLIKAAREINPPFSLSVLLNDGSLCEVVVREVLRLLPGKRIVAVAYDGEKLILVKLFIGRFSLKYLKREAGGVLAIESAGVNTPAVLWRGKLRSGGGYVLAFEYISGAKSLIEEWDDAKDNEERLALTAKIMPVLAKMHERGVIQNDIHPGNFLTLGDTVYTIDGGDVTNKGLAPLSERKSLQNLALYFAQFLARFDELIPEAFDLYLEKRGWMEDKSRSEHFQRELHRYRDLRKSDYIQKAFRECTRFSCQRSFTRLVICERKHDTPALRGILGDLDAAIDQGRLLKDGNTATVALIDGPAGPLVVKRYNIKSFGHRLNRAFRRSRAWMSWANTVRLELIGIDTLKPVALIEARFGPMRGRAYLITEYVEGADATTLGQLDDPDPTLLAMVKILKGLSDAHLTHGDLKASNFLLGVNGPIIIDLDSMTEHRHDAEMAVAQRKDLARFMQNWESAPDLGQKFQKLLASRRD
jgi:tRNA A-37 threonylcarbamoyl transferase component Bud32